MWLALWLKRWLGTLQRLQKNLKLLSGLWYWPFISRSTMKWNRLKSSDPMQMAVRRCNSALLLRRGLGLGKMAQAWIPQLYVAIQRGWGSLLSNREVSVSFYQPHNFRSSAKGKSEWSGQIRVLRGLRRGHSLRFVPGGLADSCSGTLQSTRPNLSPPFLIDVDETGRPGSSELLPFPSDVGTPTILTKVEEYHVPYWR